MKNNKTKKIDNPFETFNDEDRLNAQIAKDLLKGVTNGEEIKQRVKDLVRILVQGAMKGEMSAHLGYDKSSKAPAEQINRRNGSSKKILQTEQGPVRVDVPRDRHGSYEPVIIKKHERGFTGFNDQILALYARGMSSRDIAKTFEDIYGLDVSTDIVTQATASVVNEVEEWQGRLLESTYTTVFIDALVVKTRETGVVTNRSAYIVVGVSPDGHRDVLGIWLQASEGAKFWQQVLTDLRQRGVEDILILCADGLKGLPESVAAVYPRSTFQSCIVHMIRSSTHLVPWKDKKDVCADLKTIYTSSNEDQALIALDNFDKKWGKVYPVIGKSWRHRWPEICPFLNFPPEVRKTIYTTNTIEGLNRILRKSIKTRGHFPNDQAAITLMYLAIRNAKATWGRKPHNWKQQLLQLSNHFEDRLTIY